VGARAGADLEHALRRGDPRGEQREDGPAEPAADEPGAAGTAAKQALDGCLHGGRGHLVEVTKALVRGIHQSSEDVRLAGTQRIDGLSDPLVFRQDMGGSFLLGVGQLTQLARLDVAQ